VRRQPRSGSLGPNVDAGCWKRRPRRRASRAHVPGYGTWFAPPRRDAPVQFDLPRLETARDAAKAAGAVLEAVSDGELTPTEGAHIMALVESYRRTLETTELEARVAALEVVAR